MLPSKVSFFLSRAARGWRKLPWDWRALILWHGSTVVYMMWRLGDVVLAGQWGPEFVPVGPFVLSSNVGHVVWCVFGVAVVIELCGLLLLAKWVWHFGVIVNGIGAALQFADVISGATYRAAELSGWPVRVEGFAVRLTWIGSALFAVFAGMLAWRIARRRALLKACGVDTAVVRGVAATDAPPLNTPTAPASADDEKGTPQEGNDDPAAPARP